MAKALRAGWFCWMLIGLPVEAAQDSAPAIQEEESSPTAEAASFPSLTPALIDAATGKGVDANRLIATLLAAELTKATLEQEAALSTSAPTKVTPSADIYQKLFSTIYYNLTHAIDKP